MKETKQFIEDAIEGGWTHTPRQLHDWRDEEGNFHETPMTSVFLDPLAWQAVGKTRGWYDDKEYIPNSWLMKWTEFIDHLADGKTIEEALEAISK